MRSLLIATVCISATGCAAAPTPQPNVIQSLVRRCGMVGQVDFEQMDDNYVALSRLDPNADYDRIKCVLDRLAARGIEVGFIAPEGVNN